ncbi:hypothetical protein [Oryzifoliimicrobium ureilyticus]|uniref:hypothetical protein n=1 Tax=Oryzifoliimicrobium ureilyticus TaxID=3113724 RepID=UPI003076446B
MSDVTGDANANQAAIRELAPHELDEVSGGLSGSIQTYNGKIVGFQVQIGSFSVGEMAVAGGSSYNYWSTPFGSGSYWATN